MERYMCPSLNNIVPAVTKGGSSRQVSDIAHYEVKDAALTITLTPSFTSEPLAFPLDADVVNTPVNIAS
jgi:hypothetical protein